MIRLLIFALSVGIGSARAADVGCDTPGVAQMIIPNMFADNASAKKLGLEVDSVTLVSVEDTGCIIKVKTNKGFTLKYRFQYEDGVAALDMIN